MLRTPEHFIKVESAQTVIDRWVRVCVMVVAMARNVKFQIYIRLYRRPVIPNMQRIE